MDRIKLCLSIKTVDLEFCLGGIDMNLSRAQKLE